MARDDYNWNPAFNFIMGLKDDYINTFPDDDSLYEPDVVPDTIETPTSCLIRWATKLDNYGSTYLEKLEPLIIVQVSSLILIKYKSISSYGDDFWKMYDGLYTECRSILIDLKNEAIILCPFKKFHNLNEIPETNIDVIREKIINAKFVEITDKLDGSMISARRFDNAIMVSTSSSIEPKTSWRLMGAYKFIFHHQNYKNMILDNSDYTFIFESIFLNDAHCVQYTKQHEGLYLIGMRNVHDGGQLSYIEMQEYIKKYNVMTTNSFDKSFDDILDDIKTIKSNEQEGYVLNIDGFFVKIKGDDYVKMHRVLNIHSLPNTVIKNIADGTFDDFISKIPEIHKDNVEAVAKIVFDYVKESAFLVNEYYRNFYNIYSGDVNNLKKEFMIYVDKNVPKHYRVYVRNLFLAKPNDFLKTTHKDNVRYISLFDITTQEQFQKKEELS